jgi:hypothetical protein
VARQKILRISDEDVALAAELEKASKSFWKESSSDPSACFLKICSDPVVRSPLLSSSSADVTEPQVIELIGLYPAISI